MPLHILTTDDLAQVLAQQQAQQQALTDLGAAVADELAALRDRVAALEEAPDPDPDPDPEPEPGLAPWGSSIWYTDGWQGTNDMLGPMGCVRIFDNAQGWGKVEQECAEVPTNVTLVVSAKKIDGFEGPLTRLRDSRTDGAKVIACYMHEPDAKINKGHLDAAQYVADSRTFMQAVHDRVPGVLTSQILMSYSFRDGENRPHRDLFQADLADVYGVDEYSRNLSAYPEGDLANFIAFARAAGKPWLVGEWGASGQVAGTGAERAAWLRSYGEAFRREPDCLAVCYFNSNVGGDFNLGEYPAEAAAMREVAALTE